MKRLIQKLEKAKAGSRELDCLIREALDPRFKPEDRVTYYGEPTGEHVDFMEDRSFIKAPNYTTSLDDAMALLPKMVENIVLFSHTVSGKPAWSFKCVDTAQKMGARAAKEEIARMIEQLGSAYKLAGEPRISMEKAIAEHWLEFHSTAKTSALVICATALKIIASQAKTRR